MTVFDYLDYRAFINDYLAGLPKKGRGQVNRIGEALRVHPTLVSQVLRGRKDFTIEQLHGLVSYLGLPPLEADYFLLLLHYQRAGTSALKAYYREKLDRLKEKSLNISKRIAAHRSLTENERAVFYSSWIYSAVRLYTSVGQGQTPESVSLRFDISRAKAAEVLGFLKDARLCVEEGGIFRMGTQHTHLDIHSPFLGRHHANWRMKASQRIDNLTMEEMMFTAPFSVSRDDFHKIRESLVQLIKKSAETIKSSPPEELACLNIDLFWVRK